MRPLEDQESNFFMTFNTNYIPTSDADANTVGADLEAAISATFADRATITGLLYLPVADGAGRVVPRANGGPPNFSDISSMSIDYSAEIGPTNGMLHAHALLTVRHRVPRPGVHVDMQMVRDAIRSNGTTAPVRDLAYMNVKGFGNNAAKARRYVKKDSESAFTRLVSGRARPGPVDSAAEVARGISGTPLSLPDLLAASARPAP